MTNPTTEARELCESATPGPWEVKLHNEDYGQGYGETTFFVDTDGTLLKIGIADAAEKYAKYNALSAFIARSRTLIPELCDALEKAEEQNKQLMHEVCKLACESVERDRALAKLEAEVEGWAKAKQEGRLVVLPCKVGDTVYSIHTLPNSGKKVIAEVQTDLFFIVLSVCEGRFGKTVFLTRAEAEEALKGAER